MTAIRMGKTVWVAFALLNALLLSLIFLLWQVRAERAELARLQELGAAVYPAPRPLARFSLRDGAGREFGLEQLQGAWNLVFFGFSNCPDLCPLTLSELAKYHGGRDRTTAPPLNVLFVSIDPADTPQIAADYARGFHADFIGLGGSAEQVAAFAGQMFANTGATAAGGAASGDHQPSANPAHGGHQPAADSPAGLISHSVHIAVVSPAGALVGLLRPPHRADDIAAALAMIFQRA